MDNTTNIIKFNLNHRTSKPAEASEDGPHSPEEEREIFETWGVTADEFLDLTHWGLEFRKPVLLQHLRALRNNLATQPCDADRLPNTALAEQLALALVEKLITQMSVMEIGKLVDDVLGKALSTKRDERIAPLFEELRAAPLQVGEQCPPPRMNL